MVGIFPKMLASALNNEGINKVLLYFLYKDTIFKYILDFKKRASILKTNDTFFNTIIHGVDELSRFILIGGL